MEAFGFYTQVGNLWIKVRSFPDCKMQLPYIYITMVTNLKSPDSLSLSQAMGAPGTNGIMLVLQCSLGLIYAGGVQINSNYITLHIYFYLFELDFFEKVKDPVMI